MAERFASVKLLIFLLIRFFGFISLCLWWFYYNLGFLPAPVAFPLGVYRTAGHIPVVDSSSICRKRIVTSISAPFVDFPQFSVRSFQFSMSFSIGFACPVFFPFFPRTVTMSFA